MFRYVYNIGKNLFFRQQLAILPLKNPFKTNQLLYCGELARGLTLLSGERTTMAKTEKPQHGGVNR